MDPLLAPASITRRIAGPGRRALATGLLLILTIAAPPAAASGRHDQERARAAVRAGEVMPLPAVLDRLQRSQPGQVLELELERDQQRWIYEVKLLQADGQLLKLKLDARTAEVLSVRRKHEPRDRQRAPGSESKDR